MTKREIYIKERENGLKLREIAAKYGVSYQAVASAVGKNTPGHFRPIAKENCVYENLRRWMNENKITTAELCRRFGVRHHANNYAHFNNLMLGKINMRLEDIDFLIGLTGMTYEQIVDREPYDGAKSVLNRAIKHYGETSQIVKATEEMSELTKELCKHISGNGDSDHIAEEIADVEIMLEQMKMVFQNFDAVRDFKTAKVERLISRMES